MRITRRVLSLLLFVFVVTLSGCDSTNAPTADEKDPDYAKKSADQMKEMYGVPAKRGAIEEVMEVEAPRIVTRTEDA